jgi:murein DD-endopeptidase MepM/ murein hydrolase activator NlpD
MPIAFILLVIGVVFIAGGIKNWSIPDLFVGKVIDKGTAANPGGSSDATYVGTNSDSIGSPSNPTGNKTGSGILGIVGKIIGMPYQGTHSKSFNVRGGSDNWQSENAIDVSVPVGTPVYAPVNGSIVRAGDLPGNPGGRFAGQRVTIQGSDNAFYFGHLSNVAVQAGQEIKAGTLIGYTGEANGVAHLHFAVQNGSPLDWIIKHG